MRLARRAMAWATGWTSTGATRNFANGCRLSIPLMLGVSLVSADDWILRYFASGGAGEISRLNYAKRLFAVPISVLGQATGQASMPFFARLFGEGKRKEFADTVNQSVYRISAVSVLSSAWMMAAALPLIDLVYRRGRFSFQDSQETALYFFWFALSLALWSAQALYARAFYAAGDTITPMVASTIIVRGIAAHLLDSLPSFRRHRPGDCLGCRHPACIPSVLAWLLSRKKLVALGEYAVDGTGQSAGHGQSLPVVPAFGGEAHRCHRPSRGRSAGDSLVSAVWLAVVAMGLWMTRVEVDTANCAERKPRQRRTSRYPNPSSTARPEAWSRSGRLRLLHHLHARPVIAEVFAAIQADDVRLRLNRAARRSPTRPDWSGCRLDEQPRTVWRGAMPAMHGEQREALTPTSELHLLRKALAGGGRIPPPAIRKSPSWAAKSRKGLP